MKVLINEQVEGEAWNRFVHDNPRSNIFQTHEMYRVYRMTKDVVPLLLAVMDDSKIRAGLLANISNYKGGVLKHLASRAVVQGGPLYTDKKALGVLMEHYDKLAKKKALLTQVRNMYDSSEARPVLEKQGYVYEPHLNFLIDLKKSEDELWYKISKSKRKCIKRQMNNIKVSQVDNLSDIYPMVKATYSEAGLPLVDESHFNAVVNIMKDRLRIFTAKLKDKMIGCRLVLCHKGYVYDWYAGASKEHHNLFTNDVLVWSILKQIRGKADIFDFGGAGHPDKPYGVREFKRRFGGDLVNFGRYHKEYRPALIKIIRAGYNLHRMVGLKW